MVFIGMLSCLPDQSLDMDEQFDWQGHRGARGLMPENSLPGFLEALNYPVKTLELDLAISRDNKLVVSHEPWFSSAFCTRPNGQAVTESEEQNLMIYGMDYDSVAAFDCGSRGHAGFPDQRPSPTRKPLLREVVQAADKYRAGQNKPLPNYNIEIKSKPEWDNVLTPEVEVFAKLVVREVQRLGISNRACIQSFDPRALEAVHALDSTLTTAFLIETPGSVQNQLKRLSFPPDIYSPEHVLLTRSVVNRAHQLGMQVIPWTVNDVLTMRSLIRMGVDGIITDYPNLILEFQ